MTWTVQNFGRVPGASCEDKHQTSIDHVPFSPIQVVNSVRDETVSPNTNCSQHRLLPEAAATFDACDGKHKDQSQNTFDWAGDDTQGKSVGMVLIPSLNIECQESYEISIHIPTCGFLELTGKQDQDCLPALSKVHGGREEEDAKGSVQCIDTVIEEFSERATLLCSTSETGCQHLDLNLLY